MTSLRQIESNRRNPQRSTGPKTQSGKARASQNAVRHGLTAETVIGPLEIQKRPAVSLCPIAVSVVGEVVTASLHTGRHAIPMSVGYRYAGAVFDWTV